MARRIRQGDHAAKRHTQADRARYPKHFTNRAHVVAPLREGPGLTRTGIAAAIPALVQEDDLRDIREGREPRFVNRMVEAGATVEEDQHRLLPHGATVRHEAGALDIKKESHAID